MNSQKINLLALLALVFLCACGSPSKTSVGLTSSLSLLTVDHEVIFLGRHYLSNSKFSVIADADGFEVDLLQGKWEFALIAWEKSPSGRFTGATKCGVKQDVEIKGSEFKLDLVISSSGCNDDFFRKPGFLATSGELQALAVKANESLSTIFGPSSSFTLPSGFSRFKIVYKPKSSGIRTSSSLSSFTSECTPFDELTPLLKLPAFGKAYLDLDFEIYSDSNCLSFFKKISLPMGISDHPAISRVFDSSETTIMYLGNETPSIIANNTRQLVIGDITSPTPVNRSFTLSLGSHYTGAKAVGFGSIQFPSYAVDNGSGCDATGLCSLKFTVTNTSGGTINRLVFQYTLKDSSNKESNTARAIACSGNPASSCDP